MGSKDPEVLFQQREGEKSGTKKKSKFTFYFFFLLTKSPYFLFNRKKFYRPIKNFAFLLNLPFHLSFNFFKEISLEKFFLFPKSTYFSLSSNLFLFIYLLRKNLKFTKKRMSTVFSPTQERLFLQMFQLLATKAAPGIYDSILKLEMPTDTVFSSLVNYSLASGTILQAIKHFIGADFVKNQQDKSFLRDGSFASKIVCKFLGTFVTFLSNLKTFLKYSFPSLFFLNNQKAISGKPFFQDVLGDFINQIINEDKSWDERF